MDPYITMGVHRNSTPDEIKKAYRKLAGIHHPDKGGDTKRFQEIQQAYDLLTTPRPTPTSEYNRNPFADLMRQHAESVRQKNYTLTVYVTLEQVAIGTVENIQVNINGSQSLVQIKVPKGVNDGEQYKFNNVLPDGPLMVTFKLYKHNKFDRHGLDLHMSVTVNVLELMVGTTVIVSDIMGTDFELTIPANTKPGTKFRVQRRGLSSTDDIGDQYILINIEIPDRISADLFEMIKLELTRNSKGTHAS